MKKRIFFQLVLPLLCLFLLVALLAFALEVFLLRNAVPLFADETVMLWLTPFFGAAFGSYFVFFCKEKLPPFYDQYRVNFYSDGVLRMNVPGVYFNNRNWPHIVDAVRTWSCAVMAGWAPLFVLVWQLQRAAPEAVFVITFITGMTSILGGRHYLYHWDDLHPGRTVCSNLCCGEEV